MNQIGCRSACAGKFVLLGLFHGFVLDAVVIAAACENDFDIWSTSGKNGAVAFMNSLGGQDESMKSGPGGRNEVRGVDVLSRFGEFIACKRKFAESNDNRFVSTNDKIGV